MAETTTILQSPELAWFADRLAARFEQGLSLKEGTLSVKNATPAQRRSIDDLLGRRSTGGRHLVIDLSKLELPNLEETILKLRGPLRNRRAEREMEAARWAELFSKWKKRVEADTAALRWLEKLESSGLLKRYGSDAELLLEQAWKIIKPTPPHGEILLASLAAQVSGDSHALDRGRPLSTLCLRAILEIKGIDGTANADARREAWAAVGVSVDDISAPILCLNLRAEKESDLAQWIGWHVARGEPFYLTSRQVPKFIADESQRDVYVCENPAIVSEAANRLGPRSRGLVCLNGAPTASAKFLLRRLSQIGIRLHLRADFDWSGLSFIEQLLHLQHALPWHMEAADYAACKASQPLKGEPCNYRWATELAEAMERSGCAAYEEELVDILIDDLDISNQAEN